jgi:hypothetical protein
VIARALVLLSFSVAAFAVCASPAGATTEFCPAHVAQIRAIDGDDGTPASAFRYVIGAITPRQIGAASVIADTDHGWYAWSIADVPIVATSTGRYSPWLGVTFPEPLTIRHAWITSAKATSVTGFGWETLGTFDCEVPAFSRRGIDDAPVAREQTRRPNASPASSAPPSSANPQRAMAVDPPFASLDCAIPFRQATVKEAFSPDFPRVAMQNPPPGNLATSRIVVYIDEQGHLVDSAIYDSSGSAPLDLAALRAARRSTYVQAISYCQNVRGTYVFNATFEFR